METLILRVDPNDVKDALLTPAVDALLRENVIGFPTETVYGLGGLATSKNAVQEIFRVKGRPSDNPLIVHVSKLQDLEVIGVDIPDLAYQLANMFWPGPLTLVVKRSSNVVPDVTKGLDTVAVRLPSHPVALALLRLVKEPIAAPSANLSGRPSPTLAEHVIEDFQGKIPVIIDSGLTGFGVESTVVNVLTDPPTLLRPGGVTLEELQKIIPDIHVPKSLQDVALVSPGMKYRHYSPRKPVTLLVNAWNAPASMIDGYLAQMKNNTLLYCTNPKHKHTHHHVHVLGNTLREIQQNLFVALRDLDHSSFAEAVIEGVPEHKEGLAIMNRLRKAASKHEYLA